MTDPVRWTGQMPPTANQDGGRQPARNGAGGGGGDGTNLADILERVLDKGIVIAGDVQINLLDIELLTIKLRLLIASADTAKEMGIDWWEHDPFLTGGKEGGGRAEELDRRLGRIEAALEAGSTSSDQGADGIDDRLSRIEAALEALARDRGQ